MISVTESRKAFFCRLHPSLCSTISRLSRPTWQSKNSSCRCFTPRSVGASGKYGCLTIHVDPAKFLLAYRHKVVFCLAFRVVRHFQTHRRTGQQQFPAPPGVFDMDGFHRAIHIYMGNKTVGAVKKNAVHDLSVFQCLLHFHFCLIRLRQNHWLHAKTDSCKRLTTGRSLFISYSFVIHRPCRLQ